MTAAPSLLQRLARVSLVTQIVIGLIAGILLALLLPEAARATGFIGKVFVTALKAVAPILVFVLVMASIANHKHGQETHIKPILFLYLLGTFAAAVVAVVASMLFPSSLVLVTHDVEEALFLANRVIVFSDRPAKVKADIAVELPYPRHRGDPHLADLRRRILGLLGLDATW